MLSCLHYIITQVHDQSQLINNISVTHREGGYFSKYRLDIGIENWTLETFIVGLTPAFKYASDA